MRNHLLLTVREVSELLRIRRQKVYLLIELGCLTGFKIGNDWRVRKESVEKLMGPIPGQFFEEQLDEAA